MKVLVVEDEPRIQEYLEKGLALKGWSVDVASDGQEGLDLALAENYDVIILDRMLPVMSGDVVCKQLRLAENHTPVLMLTAQTQVSDRVAGLDLGADDYLGKPFAFAELLARLKALTRRPKTLQNRTMKVADLQLNPQTFEVKRGKTPVQLSRTEFALLEFLMRHKGQVLSKDQLTQQVWSYESEVLGNTAQVYIGYLRKKIDTAFPELPPLIQTVRGFGYSLRGGAP